MNNDKIADKLPKNTMERFGIPFFCKVSNVKGSLFVSEFWHSTTALSEAQTIRN
jgi:hypothetical protein